MVYDARLQKGNVSCLIISDNSLFVCKICVPVISILYLGIIANGLVPFISGQGSLKVNFSYNFFFFLSGSSLFCNCSYSLEEVIRIIKREILLGL